MSALRHDEAELAAYVLGALELDEVERFEAHLAICGDCVREVGEFTELRDRLDEVPPEAFLDGPPEGGDLLLQRTLRSIRAAEPPQSTAKAKPPILTLTAVAAALSVLALGAGVLVGRGTAPVITALPEPAISTHDSVAPGTRVLTGDNVQTGVNLTADVTPASGWVVVHVAVHGVSDGEQCQIFVVPKRGAPVIAGSWVATTKHQASGLGVTGSALVAPQDVASVDIVTVDGRTLVSARV
jgi:anti-sigma factor RsiW